MTLSTARLVGLKQMLEDRRRSMQVKLEDQLRRGRADRSTEVRDIVDLCDVGIEEELTFALLQLGNETLAGIDAALGRLEAGEYGRCFECGSDIPERRLRAQPFAVRCTQCEAQRELSRAAEQRGGRQQGSVPLFPDLQGA